MISPASSSAAAVPDVASGNAAATAAPPRAPRPREDFVAAAPPRGPAPSVRARAAAVVAARRSGAAGYASAASPTAKGTDAKADPLAFLRDSKLSIDEKLMRLLAYMNARWEKDLQKKLTELGGASGAASSGAAAPSGAKAASAGKGSLLEKIVGGAKQFFPAVGFALDALKNPAVRAVATKIGGPVLAAAATAMGFPEIAPALLKYAPGLVDAAAGLAASLDPPSGSGTASASSGGSTPASGAKGGEPSDSDRQLKLMEIQRIQEKQREMFQLVSNMLRSSHDLRMSIVGNLR